MNKIKLLILSMILGLSNAANAFWGFGDSKDEEIKYKISLTFTTQDNQKLSTSNLGQKGQLGQMATDPTSRGFCLRGIAEALNDVSDKYRRKQTEDIQIVLSEATLRRGTNDLNRYTLPGLTLHLENHFADSDLLDQMQISDFVKPVQIATQSLSLEDMESKCEDVANDLLERAFNFRENVDEAEKEEREKIDEVLKKFSSIK